MAREHSLTVWTSREALDKFDRLAAHNDMSRAELARICIKAGVNDLILNGIIKKPEDA